MWKPEASTTFHAGYFPLLYAAFPGEHQNISGQSIIKFAEAHSAFGGYNDILSGNNGQSDLGIAGYDAGTYCDDVTDWGSLQGADLAFSLFNTI